MSIVNIDTTNLKKDSDGNYIIPAGTKLYTDTVEEEEDFSQNKIDNIKIKKMMAWRATLTDEQQQLVIELPLLPEE